MRLFSRAAAINESSFVFSIRISRYYIPFMCLRFVSTSEMLSRLQQQ